MQLVHFNFGGNFRFSLRLELNPSSQLAHYLWKRFQDKKILLEIVILRNSIYCDGNRNVDCISHLWHMVIFLLLLLMFENFIEEGQSVLAESPKMAAATPSTNLKAETRPLFPRGLPYSPSPFNVKQFLWPSFTPLKKRAIWMNPSPSTREFSFLNSF